MGTRRDLLGQTSSMYLDNIDHCIRYRADINTIFDTTEEATKELYEWTCHVLSNYENVSSIHASGILFATLISLSHFTQNSMYVHWKETADLKNINLFGLIIGLSGSDKSSLINIIHSCYKTCELLFPDTYITDGKQSIMHDVTGAGLHKELANGSKFLLMHEADANLTKLGFYHHGQAPGVSTRSLLCEAFDGFIESSKTTGMYDFTIKDARLSLLGATTGGSLHLLLAYYANHKISDGCDNRFLYYFIENDLIPYDLVKKSDQFSPSLQQLFVIIHLIGKIVYKFVDSNGNDESQRFYVTKGRYYIEEGRRLFRDREQPHLQSFYSKSAEIFPRLCVSMQRILDAMAVLLEMKKNADLQFSQTVDQVFVLKAKKYVQLNIDARNSFSGHVTSHVSLETCEATAILFDKFLFKTTIALFNMDPSRNQSSLPSNNFRSLLAERISNEKRLLQLPFQFFLRSDLKQPTINDEGKKINGPFHHVNPNQLNQLLDKLVNQKLLHIGNFIARPRAQASYSYMKVPIPEDPDELEQYVHHLDEYQIKLNEYKCLLARSTLPNKCILLPDAIYLLTTSPQHIEDCRKYGLTTTVNYRHTNEQDDRNGNGNGDRNGNINGDRSDDRNGNGNGNGNINGDRSDDRNGNGNGDRNGNSNGDRSDDRNGNGNADRNGNINGDRSDDRNGNGNGDQNGNINGDRSDDRNGNGNGNINGDRSDDRNGNGNGNINGDRSDDRNGNGNGNINGDRSDDRNGNGNGDRNGNINGDRSDDRNGNGNGDQNGNINGDRSDDRNGNGNGNINGDRSDDRNGNGNGNINGDRSDDRNGNGNGNINGDRSDDRNGNGNGDRNGNINGDRSDDRNGNGNGNGNGDRSDVPDGEVQYDGATDQALFDEICEICALITPTLMRNGIQGCADSEELNSDIIVHDHRGNDRDVLFNQKPAYEFGPSAPRELGNKTPDAIPKEINNNCVGNSNGATQISDIAEPGTGNTTPLNDDNMNVNSHIEAILKYPSVILSSSDIALATRRASRIARRHVVQIMIEKGLLREDNYLVKRLAKGAKVVKGFAKVIPSLSDEAARYSFIKTLNEFKIKWETFRSYFSLSNEGFSTKTQFQLSEVAERLLDSDDYKPFIKYDKRVVYRIKENEIVEQDDLESGANVTDIQPFESLGKSNTKRKGPHDLRRSKRTRK